MKVATFIRESAQHIIDSFTKECDDFGQHEADEPVMKICKGLVEEKDNLALQAYYAIACHIVRKADRFLAIEELKQLVAPVAEQVMVMGADDGKVH